MEVVVCIPAIARNYAKVTLNHRIKLLAHLLPS